MNTLTTSRSSDPLAMTLHEFQNSSGIATSEQIVLVNNRVMFDSYQPCFFPWGNFTVPRFASECWYQKLIFGPKRYSMGKGKLADRLFAGFYDCSFNNLELLKTVLAKLARKKDKQFEMVIGKSDYTITDQFANTFPPNVTRILANNINVEDDRFKYLPMGRDFRSAELF